jgi:multisubunit Na+/H+ antiporter MnhB subunit
MRRLLVVDVSVGVIFHTALVGSIYLLFAGHNQPGGGFVGGLVAGAAIALRAIAGGIDEVRALTRLRPWTFLGLGILAASLTALVPVLFGEPVLTSGKGSATLPLIGTVTASSVLAFDIGVYLVVVGMVFMMFEAFGDDLADDLGDDRADDRAHDAADDRAADDRAADDRAEALGERT